MKKYMVFVLVFGVGVLFNACEDSLVLSSGNDIDEKTLRDIESMDKVSYAGLENVFLDSKTIDSNGKPTLLIFGKNNCPYCDKLKDDIKTNASMQEILAKNFSAYYINIDYSKLHHLAQFFGKIAPYEMTTLELAQAYQIRPTPTLVFLDSQGMPFFTYPGYLQPKQFSLLLELAKEHIIVQADSTNVLSKQIMQSLESSVAQ